MLELATTEAVLGVMEDDLRFVFIFVKCLKILLSCDSC